jgi:Cdc6-like AAA superfamily ATPase
MKTIKFNDVKKIIKKIRTIDEMLKTKSEIDTLIKDRLKELGYVDKLNTVLQFLCEAIYPCDNDEFRSKEIYEMYKEWCRNEDTRKPYGKNKFYELIKLEPRIIHRHMSTGDYFIIKLDVKTEERKISF